jgi:hypothetical protein
MNSAANENESGPFAVSSNGVTVDPNNARDAMGQPVRGESIEVRGNI